MSEILSKLLHTILKEVPLIERPFLKLGWGLGVSEQEVFNQILKLQNEIKAIKEISGTFDPYFMDHKTCLVAMKLEESKLQKVALALGSSPKITQVFYNDYEYNLWLIINYHSQTDVVKSIQELEKKIIPEKSLILPIPNAFKNEPIYVAQSKSQANISDYMKAQVDFEFKLAPLDIAILKQLQKPLRIISEPFTPLAESVDLSLNKFFDRTNLLIEKGVLKKFSAILSPNASASRSLMVLWDVPFYRLESVSNLFSSISGVCYCYQLPENSDLPYNLFTMIISNDNTQLNNIFEEMERLSGDTCLSLPTIREYKRDKIRFYS